jgi:hypothetical protein
LHRRHAAAKRGRYRPVSSAARWSRGVAQMETGDGK